MLSTLRADLKSTPRSLTSGILPAFIDEKQPPHKRQPFGMVLNQRYIHSVDLILSAELADKVTNEFKNVDHDQGSTFAQGCVRYAKVIMSLGEVIEERFLTHYIKTGNIMMISEGREAIDNYYKLIEGTLILELDKATYERAGLVGRVIPDGGSKHKKNRYSVELDLRQPSMLHGKRGFERLAWACRNVLTDAVTWLFFDYSKTSYDNAPAPIDAHCPRWLVAQPSRHLYENIVTPDLLHDGSEQLVNEVFADKDLATELEEWVSLAALGSPRVGLHDRADPFVCRYQAPYLNDPDQSLRTPEYLTKISWRGFLPASFAHHILITLIKVIPNEGWWTLRTTGFRCRDSTVTILRGSTRDDMSSRYLCWHGPRAD